jgi:hypothetical protein
VSTAPFIFGGFPTVAVNTLLTSATRKRGMNASGGARTFTLPDARTITGTFLLKKLDSSVNPVTIGLAVGGQTIDGAASIQLTALNECVFIESNEVDGYYVIAVGGGAGSVGATELQDLYLMPEAVVVNASTRTQPITFEGGSLIVRRRVIFNRIEIRVTAVSAPGVEQFLLYQTANGGSGVQSLKATCSVTPGAPGTFVLTPSEGTVTLAEGLCSVLCGRSSAGGNVSLRTHTIISLDLITTNVSLDVHPLSFTTTISATTTPATFDPRTSPTGAAVPAGSLDVIPVVRVKTV